MPAYDLSLRLRIAVQEIQMHKVPDDLRSFEALKQVVQSLRDPNGGCPWDLKQTHQSLCQYAIEETYEMVEAIEEQNDEDLKEELGDVLLQVVLHSEIARQRSAFDIHDVIEVLNEKMTRRHPHVFDSNEVKNADEVLHNWEEIKKQEKKDRKFFDYPLHLPALQRALKIGNKTRKLGFDWTQAQEVMLKLEEELTEVREEIQSQNREALQEEIGDLLFVIAQLARHYEMDPEQCLRNANLKFETRFEKMHKLAQQEELDWDNLSLEQKEELWQRVKKELKKL